MSCFSSEKKEMYTRVYNIYNIKRAEKSQAAIEEICFTSLPRKLTSGLHIYILIRVVGGQPTKPFHFNSGSTSTCKAWEVY